MTLAAVEAVPLRASEADVVGQFGEPSRKLSPDKVNWVSWLYQGERAHRSRMTFTFDKGSHYLLSKTFEIWETDPEVNVEVLKAKYVTLRKRDPAWTNPHIAPDEVYYEDETKGISVEVRKTSGEVAAITWYDPKNRSVALTEQKGCEKVQEPSGLISCLPSQ